MTSYPSINDLADQITDKKQFNDLIARQQKNFEINPFKIEKIYSESVKKIYSQILAKYQVTKQYQVLENVWNENERRVFVWYMIVLFDIWSLSLETIKQIQWESLSHIFFGKNAYFLEFQFSNILKSKSKITWKEQEDKILLEAMAKQRPGKWNEVSKRIFYESGCKLFKSPKHCRQRWFNHLDQSKNKGSWTLEEDYVIFKFIIENGKRWACIVKKMESRRTEHMIKNRYNSLISRLKKNKKIRQEQIAEVVFKRLEADLKREKRERKMRNEEDLTQLKKSNIINNQTRLEQNIEKIPASEEDNQENTNQKNVDLKVEQEMRQQQEFIVQKLQMGQENYESVFYEANLFNIYNYAEPFIEMQGYPGFYYFPLSTFLPFNQGYL